MWRKQAGADGKKVDRLTNNYITIINGVHETKTVMLRTHIDLEVAEYVWTLLRRNIQSLSSECDYMKCMKVS